MSAVGKFLGFSLGKIHQKYGVTGNVSGIGGTLI